MSDNAGTTDALAGMPATRFGIKPQLSLAFIAMTAMTALVGAVAWLIFEQIEHTVVEITEHSIPEITLATQIADVGADITAFAPTITASRTQNERVRRRDRLDGDGSRLRDLVSQWTHEQVALSAAARLSEAADNIARQIEIADRAVEDQLNRAASINERSAVLDKTHTALLDALEPLIDDAVFEVVIEGEQSATGGSGSNGQDLSELIDTGVMSLLHLLTLQADGNLAVGILREVADTSDLALLTPMAERFRAVSERLERTLPLVPATIDRTVLQQNISILTGSGLGTDNIFELKRTQLQQAETAQAALGDIRIQSAAISSAVAELVQAAEDESRQTAARARDIIGGGHTAIAAISVASVGFAILMLILFVGPRLVRPIEQTTNTMSRLAAGDTDVAIPGLERRDEIGRMARALEVFRDITIEVQESNLREIETARRRLHDAIESISEGFSLYNGEDQLVVCNDKYGELVHPEIADRVEPGMTFEEIVRMSLDEGLIEEARGREEEWLRERLAVHRNPGQPHLMKRSNGMWIMVSERQTAEGGIVAVYSDITELKERENELAAKSKALEDLSGQLSKYLSPQIYQSIFSGQQAATVASERKKLTVFFSDLEGFTEKADRMEAEDLSNLLNEYLTEMSQIALEHGATIDKYVGDAVIAFFGDPVSRGLREDALACVRMAIAMQKRLEELAPKWAASGLSEQLQCRMGISTGYCTVGNFGSEDRMDYTIIGSPVNLASRLETAAMPGSILISAETRNLVHQDIPCREHETLEIKGFAYPVKSYLALFDDAEGTDYISERSDNLTIDVDLEAMTASERKKATEVLEKIVNKLKDGDHDERP
ncbi:adenylate/guanylate cyclase domain-containing protein [Hoeflea prorocentri]|uniref:PAS-domain containing protein n=1 Tax=Hoeflea prorocentri TaxID=1922333 RepID=A0A9X3ZI26_9HYPH|nr:adenylate/guanylate cyclase domain-containing protein [Hoeflea prorocentri]MCY6382467.1 PAS-domain containing protein [Hoeflea prorocentri]MDA5400267.1 PAS-domain containing protein [Hoeflea prorocentri]